MTDTIIYTAQPEDYLEVAELVTLLLLELEPEAADEIKQMPLAETTQALLASKKIVALLAKQGDELVGGLTLHECAAIYAGGVFGEISELYVKPAFRSDAIGGQLLDAATEMGKSLGWQRLEVGTPPPESSPRTLAFYCKQGFEATGTRLRRLIV